MWIRSAFWIGRPKPEQDQIFIDAIETEVLPGLRPLPGVRSVQALWPKRLEDGPPGIYCQILVTFDDVSAIDAMLGSPAVQRCAPVCGKSRRCSMAPSATSITKCRAWIDSRKAGRVPSALNHPKRKSLPRPWAIDGSAPCES